MTTVHRLAETDKGMLRSVEQRMHGRATSYVVQIDRTTFFTRLIDQIARELGATAAERVFEVRALLFVPDALSNEALAHALDALATEMKMDLALGERHAPATARA
jgi:glycine cleavage system regulatory protein